MFALPDPPLSAEIRRSDVEAGSVSVRELEKVRLALAESHRGLLAQVASVRESGRATSERVRQWEERDGRMDELASLARELADAVVAARAGTTRVLEALPELEARVTAMARERNKEREEEWREESARQAEEEARRLETAMEEKFRDELQKAFEESTEKIPRRSRPRVDGIDWWCSWKENRRDCIGHK